MKRCAEAKKLFGSVLLDGRGERQIDDDFSLSPEKGNITQLSSVFLIISYYTETTKRERERGSRKPRRDILIISRDCTRQTGCTERSFESTWPLAKEITSSRAFPRRRDCKFARDFAKTHVETRALDLHGAVDYRSKAGRSVILAKVEEEISFVAVVAVKNTQLYEKKKHR